MISPFINMGASRRGFKLPYASRKHGEAASMADFWIWWILAALLVTRVRDVADLDVPEDAVLQADEKELLTVAESVQPVPSTGLIDK